MDTIKFEDIGVDEICDQGNQGDEITGKLLGDVSVAGLIRARLAIEGSSIDNETLLEMAAIPYPNDEDENE